MAQHDQRQAAAALHPSPWGQSQDFDPPPQGHAGTAPTPGPKLPMHSVIAGPVLKMHASHWESPRNLEPNSAGGLHICAPQPLALCHSKYTYVPGPGTEAVPHVPGPRTPDLLPF